jgi:hypothetical protein
MNISHTLRTLSAVFALILLAAGTAFSASGTPGKPDVTVAVGSGQAHFTFENTALAGTLNMTQMKLLAARVGAQEGDFFFIVTERVPGNVFACGSCSSIHGSVSINLPPNSTVLRVSASRGNGESTLLINGVSNESAQWMSFSSADFGRYVTHRAPRELASSK